MNNPLGLARSAREKGLRSGASQACESWQCRMDMDRSDDDPLYPTGPPRVVRYGTTVAALESRARAETRGLAGC